MLPISFPPSSLPQLPVLSTVVGTPCQFNDPRSLKCFRLSRGIAAPAASGRKNTYAAPTYDRSLYPRKMRPMLSTIHRSIFLRKITAASHTPRIPTVKHNTFRSEYIERNEKFGIRCKICCSIQSRPSTTSTQYSNTKQREPNHRPLTHRFVPRAWTIQRTIHAKTAPSSVHKWRP